MKQLSGLRTGSGRLRVTSSGSFTAEQMNAGPTNNVRGDVPRDVANGKYKTGGGKSTKNKDKFNVTSAHVLEPGDDELRGTGELAFPANSALYSYLEYKDDAEDGYCDTAVNPKFSHAENYEKVKGTYEK